MFTLGNLLTWLIVGIIAGSLTARVVTRQKAGYGLLTNIALGCGGALIGGGIFWLFNLLPALDKVAISARDVVAAVAGSLILLAGMWAWRRWQGESA
ncbi:MAG TPA: GlsB/YeaQ/YmgE family stress response membrane protein [Rhodoblastus sp.]|nr:GlsB/YeaQ/YmgE family stress response membrane protein [Rhodoblastus sp.]